MHLGTDVGYVALLTMLVIVPAAAVGAAVLDRMMWHRRNGVLRRPSSPIHAFPVVLDPRCKVVSAPLPALEAEGKDGNDSTGS